MNRSLDIHIACRSGNLDIVQFLLEERCDIEARDENNWRPIHIACDKGHLEIVKLLVRQKCNIEARDTNNWRPIHIACDKGHLEIVKLLLRKKCNIEARDKKDYRPIHLACDKGHADIVKLLLGEKCDIEACDRFNQRPIHFACINGNIDIVKLLLGKECNIEARDKNDCRPIHVASEKGQFEVVRLLCDYSCDIEARNKNGWRPIHFAYQSGSLEIVQLLIVLKCDMNATTNDNKTPSSIATQRNNAELAKKKLMAKINQVSQVKCIPDCDHKSCLMDLFPNPKKSIGQGGFGKVYKLTDPETNFEYALKSIKLDRVCTEVKGLEDDINKYRDRIKHPRIMEYYGSISRPTRFYIFMEFVPNGSIQEKISKAGSIPLPQQTILRYTKQILEGLEFLYDKKVIHRDIKPENILLDANDNTKLCDFGLSRVLETISIRSGKCTSTDRKNNNQANTFCGTPNYMAPETIDGEGYSFSADIWSLGATIVYMLTGQPPYSDLAPGVVMFRIYVDKKIEFQPLTLISEDMKEFMKEIFNPDPAKRMTATGLLQFLSSHNMVIDNDSMGNPQELE